MPSTPLDAYGLLLSACQDPNPVMFLEPKALLRMKGEEPIPGEPGDDRALSKMIDAPLGDRTAVEAAVARRCSRTPCPSARRSVVREGTTLTVVSYGRTLPLCGEGRRRRSRARASRAEVIDLRSLWPYDWEAIAGVGEEDRPGALRERGHRGDQLRRAPGAPHGGGALLRAARAAAAARREVRPRHRPGRPAGDGERAAARRTSPRPCGRWPASSPEAGRRAHFRECSPIMLPSVS